MTRASKTPPLTALRSDGPRHRPSSAALPSARYSSLTPFQTSMA